jgi:hypothetical protein
VQVVAEVHETPSSKVLPPPFTFWAVCMDQLVPFHRSASVSWVPVLLV